VDPLVRPDWWRFRDCNDITPFKAVSEPEWGQFLDYAIRLIAPPTLAASVPDRDGTFTLTWTSPAEPETEETPVTFVVEEAAQPDFAGAVPVFCGEDQRLTLYGRGPGVYYFHVRTVVGPNSSDWSNGVVVSVGLGTAWRMYDPQAEEDAVAVAQAADVMLEVHSALLRTCAASGELFAVLGLPRHYQEDAVIGHVQALQPLGYGEPATLSYGALYHPWLVGRDGDRVRITPPDGAICGTYARRALARGAWVAPANERLNGVVALTPPVRRERWLSLQEAQANLIRQEPYGFVTLSSDTLSYDELLRPVNVRRLLILLRRLALRQGQRYVFEPMDAVFRRTVQRSFERVLDTLFARGAFAGATPATSYRVSVVSTPHDIDLGRFIVELRVAPSLPLTFITVRLIQSGNRSLVVEEL
jgi:hypothetical protein